MWDFISRLFAGKSRGTPPPYITMVNEQNAAVTSTACNLVAVQTVMAETMVPGFQKTQRPFFLGYVSGLCHGLSAQMGIDPSTEEANLATLRAVSELDSSTSVEDHADELTELHEQKNPGYLKGQDVGFQDAYSFTERKSALGLVRGLTQ